MKEGAKSADMETHTKTSTIRTHWAELDRNGQYVRPDRETSMADEPGHQALCDREQAYVLKAIREDIDLSQHMADGGEFAQDRAGGRSKRARRPARVDL